MNPNSRNGGELTPASTETPAEHYRGNETDISNTEKNEETNPAAPEQQAKMAAPPLAIPTPTTPVLPTDDDGDRALSPENVSINQPDRIEKQDLLQAKSIIEKTTEDPYARKSEMSKFKAQYIEKRFHKKIKVDT